MKGTVLRVGGGRYRVGLDDGRRVEASLRGRLKLETRTGDRVVIGDRVRVEEAGEGTFAIEEVLPRRCEFVRRGPDDRRAKVVAANVDRLLVVVAAAEPDPSSLLVDRLLVLGEASEVEPVLVINKMDLEETGGRGSELAELYREVGYRILLTSARTGRGIEALRDLLCRGVSALVGPSGAGKSSLLNRVEPGLELRTGELSEKPRTGRHTTVTARLLELGCGGRVADTPGFSDVGLWGVDPDELDLFFPEIAPRLEGCRFRRCSHLHEPGCAVREAVDRGEIDPRRWESYAELRAEAEEAAAPPWER